jgi:uroporphyrinogen-III decarboxylase
MSEQTSVKDLDADKTAEQLVAERNQRVLDAVNLKQPDRIPVILGYGFLLAEMGGITKQELYENPEKAQLLMEEAARRFQPDTMLGAWHTPGPSRVLGDRMTKWPGLGLGPNGSFQFNEQEFMKAEDYDAFIEDPADWAIRTYMPRAFSELEALSMLPPLGMAAFGYYNVLNYTVLTAPPVAEAFQKIGEAAQIQAKWLGEQIDSMQRLAAMGYPPLPFLATLIEAPFDFMSDTLRGMRGIFLDMLRIPDKLLAAQEKVLTFEVEHAIANAAAAGNPFVFIPLHRGSDGFMSLKQFETFYWKQLKEMMLALIDADLIPWVYYEGIWDERLEYLADLPAGKSVGMFQDTDLFKAKEVIGDTLCIVGGMPLSHLKPGSSPEKIRELTKRLCEEVGKDGGYIMANTVLELEGCDPDLIDVWMDATREYGVYG